VKIAVTGASGYIGQRLVRLAQLQGHTVIVLARKPLPLADVEWMNFDLAEEHPIVLPDDVDAVFHLAAVTQRTSGDEGTEEAAALRLLAAAARINARFLFVSSQTARSDAPTGYGRIKWRIEQSTLAAGGWVLRPGQVYGGPEQGLFGILVGLVRRLPVLPAFLPSPRIQPVHVDDLAEALLACVVRSLPPGLLHVGEAVPMSFTSFLSAVSIGRLGHRRLFFPFPVVLLQIASFVLGTELSARLGLERLNSLFEMPCMETRGDLLRLGIQLRPLVSGMARSGSARRRWLVQEGRALLAYVLREPPTSAMTRRYVRCVEQLREAGALDMHGLVLRFPAFVALHEQGGMFQTALRGELGWRLNAAVMLAEASPQGARRFIRLGRPSGLLTNGLQIVRGVACEVAWRFVRAILVPLLVLISRPRGER
jgi:uncharacterized protein YbjT (DUF2867 family)